MGKYTLTRSFNRQKDKGLEFNNILPSVTDFDSEYEFNQHMSGYPFIGSFYSRRNEELRNEEIRRRRNDRFRNLGIDPKLNPYPITSGYYNGFSNSYGEVFEVTEAIMSLYGLKWLK